MALDMGFVANLDYSYFDNRNFCYNINMWKNKKGKVVIFQNIFAG